MVSRRMLLMTEINSLGNLLLGSYFAYLDLLNPLHSESLLMGDNTSLYLKIA